MSLSLYKDLDRKETALFSVLVFSLFLMGIFPNIFLDAMLFDCISVLEHAKLGRIGV
jgi:NADH:ubiquinone oxidoreductase subunit 4 (subunit M)